MANPSGNLANLWPWKAGESGNLGGRPRGRKLSAVLAELLDATELNGRPIPGDRRVVDLLAEAIVVNAIGGKGLYMLELFQRLEGKVPPPARADDGLGALSDAELLDRIKEALGGGRPPPAGDPPAGAGGD